MPSRKSYWLYVVLVPSFSMTIVYGGCSLKYKAVSVYLYFPEERMGIQINRRIHKLYDYIRVILLKI